MSAHTEAEAGWNSKFRRGPTAQKLVALKCFCKPTDPHLLGVGSSAPSPTTDNFFVCLSGRDDVYKNSQRLAYTKYFCSFRPTWAKNWRSSSSSLIIPWGFTFKFTFCLVNSKTVVVAKTKQISSFCAASRLCFTIIILHSCVRFLGLQILSDGEQKLLRAPDFCCLRGQ